MMKLLGTNQITLGLFITGCLLVLYSLMLNPYSNVDEFNEKYSLLHNRNDSQAYFDLRETYLTSKYKFQDYGLTLVVLSGGSWLSFRKGIKSTKTFKHKGTIALVGFSAVIATCAAIAGNIFLDMGRGAFPHWADTIIIPLMGIPPIFLVLLIWFSFQLIGLFGLFKTGVVVHQPHIDASVVWYGIQLAILLIAIAVLIFEGNFLMLTAAFLWLLFFCQLFFGRSAAKLASKQGILKT